MTMIEPLMFLNRLGRPEDLWTQAEEVLLRPRPANTHIHLPPNFSAFERVSLAVQLASEQGVRVLGAGNYYDFTVYEEFSRLCLEAGIFPFFSTELIAFEPEMAEQKIRVNDPGNPGKIYLCGKGITRFSPFFAEAAEQMAAIRRNDGARMKAMIETMSERFKNAGYPIKLDEQAVIDRVVKRHGSATQTVTLQERHIAQAFQEVLFEMVSVEQRSDALSAVYNCSSKAVADDVVGTQNDIRSFLMKAGKPCFVPESFGRLCEAKTLIDRLGGIACYPILADGAAALCEYETPVEELIERLKENGFVMAEFIPVRNRPDALAAYATALRKAGIVLTAGTEHNTLDLTPLTPACADGSPIPAELNDWFWEGVCVVAAHQYLCAHGRTGFVDAHGRPNPDWPGDEERIDAFARLGQVVLNAVFDKD